MEKFLYGILNAIIVIYIVTRIFFYFKTIPEGQKAPEIKTQLVDGTEFQLSNLKGDYVLLDFWASWCGPCRVDSPKLVALNNKYRNASFQDADKFHTVSIAMEKAGNTWKNYAENAGFDWPMQIVEKNAVVMMSSIAQAYGVGEIPAKFLVLPDGTIHSARTFKEMDAFLSGKVRD